MYEYSIAKKCPICGNTLGYYVDNCGQMIKKCTACKHIIADNTVATNKTKYVYTTTSNAYPWEKDGITSGFISIHDNSTFKPIIPLTLEINCDSITLKNDSISFTMYNDKIKQFDTITINGVKFKKVEEENE